jgi:hypothetical protein
MISGTVTSRYLCIISVAAGTKASTSSRFDHFIEIVRMKHTAMEKHDRLPAPFADIVQLDAFYCDKIPIRRGSSEASTGSI